MRVKNQEISTSYLSPSPSSPPARGGEILLFTRSSVLAELGDMGKENLRVGQKRVNLLSVAEGVCKEHGVNWKELRSGSRRHAVVEARQELSRLAVMVHGYSGAEVARYLGVTNSCITRPLSLGSKKVR